MKINTALRCGLSGLTIGTLSVITTAGALPYLSHWDKMAVRHPVFSLGEYKLYQFATAEWKRLATKAADEEITDDESKILRVTWLAVLHSMGSIKQDEPALPELHTVQTTLSKLLALSYWRYHLESSRFRFPTYHLSRINDNLNFRGINDYLELCFQVKDDYSTKITEIEEAEKAKTAQAVLDALTREWISPVSRKLLWAWVRSNLPTKYDADKQGWMNTIFLGGGTAIVEFAEEDIELFEEIIITECPKDAAIMYAVRQRIAKVWEIWKQHHRTFEINLADYAVNQGILVNGVQVAMPDPGPEPSVYDFPGHKTRFLIAHAKWTIAKRAFDEQNAKSDDPIINTMLGEI